MRARFDHRQSIAKNIVSFWFTPEHPLRQTAGQFTELGIKHTNPDSRGDRRWFTLSSSPTEDKIAITTKFVGEPLGSDNSSFKKALLNLNPGDDVMLAQPMGDFVLPRDPAAPIIFIAGGIGVTPMRSMVKWLADTGEKRSIQLIYAANTLDEVAFRGLFEKYGVKLSIVLSNPPKGWKGLRGYLDAEKTINLAGGIKDKFVYMSGPPPMIKNLRKELRFQGASKKQLISDFFPGYNKI